MKKANHVFEERIGRTTYLVGVQYTKHNSPSIDEIVKKMIKKEVQNGKIQQ